jgi:hypothetical protein
MNTQGRFCSYRAESVGIVFNIKGFKGFIMKKNSLFKNVESAKFIPIGVKIIMNLEDVCQICLISEKILEAKAIIKLKRIVKKINKRDVNSTLVVNLKSV